MKTKKFLALLLAAIMVISLVPMAALADNEPSITATDCGHFVGADWAGPAGAYSFGWKYSDNFDTTAITAITVGAKDADGKLVVEYTADKDQVAWQAKNGYVTADGMSSAPFYKEANGVALTEEPDTDWTAKKGEAFDAWQPALFYVEVVAKDVTYKAEMKYDYDYPSVTATDCGVFPGEDWGTPGAFSFGWKYSDNFDTTAITSIRVAANDVDGKLVVEYTADKDQVAWQAKNGYITKDGLSSAPFYKEYKGVAIAEGRDDDWTVTKGEAFDAWQPAVFSVEVVANNCTYYAEMTNYMVIGVDVVDGTDGYTPVETPVVGQKLTANIKTTDGVIGSYPVNADATYFWHYKDSDTLLGTEPVYTVTSDNLGKVICCDVAVKGYAADAKWAAKGTVDYFTDIATSGYHDWIADAAEAGIIYGYPDHSYRPGNNVTRAQFITMLYRAAGSPEVKSTDLKFDDASAIDKNYLTAVAWGVENGVVLGYEDNTFRPDVKISRAQMATFMYRYLKDVAEYDFGDVEPCGFADADQVAAPYVDAVNAIVSAGIMNGMNAQTFAPNGTANRGMAATVMFRAYDLMA